MFVYVCVHLIPAVEIIFTFRLGFIFAVLVDDSFFFAVLVDDGFFYCFHIHFQVSLLQFHQPQDLKGLQ